MRRHPAPAARKTAGRSASVPVSAAPNHRQAACRKVVHGSLPQVPPTSQGPIASPAPTLRARLSPCLVSHHGNLNLRPVPSGRTELPCAACPPGLAARPIFVLRPRNIDARRHPSSPSGDHRRAAGQPRRLRHATARQRPRCGRRLQREPTIRSSRPTARYMRSTMRSTRSSCVRPRRHTASVPAPARTGIHNALNNLSTPVQLGNDMLDGKPRRAGDTTMRFLINTTVGVLGIFDVAKDWGYPDHDADFGLTLALWGLPDGPFLYPAGVRPIGPARRHRAGRQFGDGPLHLGGPGHHGAGARLVASRYQRDRSARAPSR